MRRQTILRSAIADMWGSFGAYVALVHEVDKSRMAAQVKSRALCQPVQIVERLSLLREHEMTFDDICNACAKMLIVTLPERSTMIRWNLAMAIAAAGRSSTSSSSSSSCSLKRAAPSFGLRSATIRAAGGSIIVRIS